MRDKSEEFVKEFSEDILQEIFEAIYSRQDTKTVKIFSVESLDREGGNIRAEVEYFKNGKSVYIEIQDGNWNGSELLSYEVAEWSEEYKVRMDREDLFAISKAFYTSKK